MNLSFLSARFAKFILIGGFAAIVNFFSRILFSHWLSYPAAISLAFLMGITTAFVMNRRYVFRDATNPLHHQVLWFTAINFAALLQTLAVSLLLADYLLPYFHVSWHAQTLAHAVGISVPIFTSYLGHKHFSFSSRAQSGGV